MNNCLKYYRHLIKKLAFIAKPALFILLVLVSFATFAQEQPISKTERCNYIQKEDTLINFKFSFYNLNQDFQLNSGDNTILLMPNFTLKTRFFVNYRYITAAIAFAPKFIPGNRDSELRGQTNSFTFNLNFFMKHWTQEFQYNKTKGFYLSNTADYESPDWEEGKDPFIQFPDLKFTVFRGATSYLTNSNFSLKAIRNHTEIQKKSAGSFMPSFIYSYYTINNSKSGRESYQNSNNFEGLLAVWYMHTFVFHKNWYISGGLSPAAGYSITKLYTFSNEERVTEYYHEPIFRINEQINFGINIKRFFTGVQFLASQTTERQGGSKTKQMNYYSTFQVFAGYRFKAPKFLKRIL